MQRGKISGITIFGLDYSEHQVSHIHIHDDPHPALPFLASRSGAAAQLKIPYSPLTTSFCDKLTPIKKPATCAGYFKFGGERGIRTPGRFDPTSDFKSGALNRALPALQIVGRILMSFIRLVKYKLALTSRLLQE